MRITGELKNLSKYVVETVGGHEVRLLTIVYGLDKPIIGLMNGKVEAWSHEGEYFHAGFKCPFNLPTDTIREIIRLEDA